MRGQRTVSWVGSRAVRTHVIACNTLHALLHLVRLEVGRVRYQAMGDGERVGGRSMRGWQEMRGGQKELWSGRCEVGSAR